MMKKIKVFLLVREGLVPIPTTIYTRWARLSGRVTFETRNDGDDGEGERTRLLFDCGDEVRWCHC